MTATTKPPDRVGPNRHRPMRFSSMESLGFSNPSSMWSDRPVTVATRPRGRHIAPDPAPDPLADWQPQEVGRRFGGSDVRWSFLIVTVVLLAAAGSTALWLYQRPAAQAEASVELVTRQAESLREVLPTLAGFNENLLGDDLAGDPTGLFDVDAAARSLFETSGELPSTATGVRSAAASASGAALDGVRLAGEAHSYRLAVGPILVAPELETDPNLVELDEAARNFGEWQLRFDDVRTALPDGVLSATTEQLDVLSGDLPSTLRRYVDALRAKDRAGAGSVLTALSGRLDSVAEQMTASLIDVQQRVSARIEDASTALNQILD